MNTRAALGCGARFTSHPVVPKFTVSSSVNRRSLRFLPSPWLWNCLRSCGFTPSAMGKRPRTMNSATWRLSRLSTGS